MYKEWSWGSLSIWSQLSAIVKLGNGFNWVDLYIIHAHIEYEKHGPSYEVEVALLGFGITLRVFAKHETDQSREIKDVVSKIKLATCVHCGKSPYEEEEEENYEDNI